MNRICMFSLWSIVIGLPACGGSNMMSDYTRVFDQHAADYQAEIAGHQSAIAAAPDLSSIVMIEADHASALQDHMMGMRIELGDMTGCMGPSGEQVDPQQVTADLDGLQMESDAHLQAMSAATDLPSALAEEARHQNQLAAMMADMQTHSSAMMDGTAQYSCHMSGGETVGGGGMM
jgi:hypothetical protein